MIDQASVFADRFRNNRQALQAAVLGQNSGVDPYTALRALQLLKESDSMQMAQQGQQPTEAPSLLQEAMQPPQMPMGMAVPGQQMSQAPQQSGGLEAIPFLTRCSLALKVALWHLPIQVLCPDLKTLKSVGKT